MIERRQVQSVKLFSELEYSVEVRPLRLNLVLSENFGLSSFSSVLFFCSLFGFIYLFFLSTYFWCSSLFFPHISSKLIS